MPSVEASPTTPSRKRRSLRLSSFDVPADASPSPYNSGTTNGTTFSRRSSRTSQTSYQPQSPVTPRPMSSRSSRPSLTHHRRKSSRVSINSVNSLASQSAGDSGLGNLADELEGAYLQEDDQGTSFLEELREGEHPDSAIMDTPTSPYADMNDMADFGFTGSLAMSRSQEPAHPASTTLSPNGIKSPSKRHSKSKHSRNDSAYDGSDYGSLSDSEDTISDLPPLLRKRIREVERLARDSHDAEDTLSEGGGIIPRTVTSLRTLGPPQSNIEYGVTRMMTACNSMATHRTHAQRDFFSASHNLMYGSSIYALPEEFLDLLMSEIDELSKSLPAIPHQNPLLSLSILANDTTTLATTLRSLTDLLQENKLAANAAMRKLKSVRDMVEDLSIDEELVENSIMLIQAGDWDRRCRERQAARACRDVCREFGEKWGIEADTTVRVAA